MKTKHTKGKWKIHRRNAAPYAITAVSGSIDICYFERYNDIPANENKANAKLMAAAPEMLKTLNYALGILKILGCSKEDKAIIRIQEAIKKAT